MNFIKYKSCRVIVFSWAMLTCLSATIFRPALAQESQPAGQPVSHPAGGYTIYVVPHAHMDLEWPWSFERAQAASIQILNEVMKLLKEDPRYAFTQDQLLALKPFWDNLSEADQQFMQRMVSEGRFEITTGMFVQPDINEPDFESLTRQLLLAKPWLEKTFGAKILTAWNIDTFGHTVQMPQLYRKAGLRYYAFSRGLPSAVKDSARNLFYWRSPDGSTVLTHLQSGHYGAGYKLRDEVLNGPPQNRSTPSPLEALIRHNPEGNDKIMFPWGEDLAMPTETPDEMESLVRQYAAAHDIPIKSVVISTPTRYFKDLEGSGIALPTYSYDFNPPLLVVDLRGIWGQRPRQKLAERRSEDALTTSEKISSIASLYGGEYAARDLNWGWRKVLMNHNHDTIGGSHADAVDRAALSRYSGALEVARQVEKDALFQLSRKIDTSSSGLFPLLVFNAQSTPRTDVVRFEPPFFPETKLTGATITNFRLLDPQGRSVPFRVLAISRFPSESKPQPLTMVEIEFVAANMPAMGYRIYRIEPIEGDLQPARWRSAKAEQSTRYFDLRIDPATGSIARLTDRRTDAPVLNPGTYGGNELVLEEENNPDMEGMIHFTGSEVRGSQFGPVSITERVDDLGVTVRVQAPFMGGKRIQEIYLYDQLPRIDFITKLKGFPGHDGMLTVMFPVRRPGKPNTAYETHNAVTLRPDGIYNAQSWVDITQPHGGLAILNRGTASHQIEGNQAQLILLRSVTQYSFYNTPRASEAGDHTFKYSLYPHAGDWSDGNVVEQAHSFNSPLRIISTDAHEGSLPLEYSFLSVDNGHFEVTALKRAEDGDGLVLRGHETRGKAGTVRLSIKWPVQQAWQADLLEQPGREVSVVRGTLKFDCRPFEFITLRLKVKP